MVVDGGSVDGVDDDDDGIRNVASPAYRRRFFHDNASCVIWRQTTNTHTQFNLKASIFGSVSPLKWHNLDIEITSTLTTKLNT